MTTRCEDVRPLLTDYVLKEVDAADAERIGAHVAGCLGCRQELDKSRAMLGLLERSAAMEELPRSIRLTGSIVAQPEAQPAHWWAAFWNNAGRMAFAGGALACLAVGLMGIMQARLSYDAGGFQIAFGEQPATLSSVISEPAPAVIPAAASGTLSKQEIEQLIAAALRASEQRLQSETGGLIRQASLDADSRRTADLQQMAETFRYMQAAQTNMWKEQMQSQQIVAMLAQKNGMSLTR